MVVEFFKGEEVFFIEKVRGFFVDFL